MRSYMKHKRCTMKKTLLVMLFLTVYSLTFAAPDNGTKKSGDIDNPLFLGHFMSKGYSINAGATWVESIDELGIITYDRIAIADKSKPNGFNNFFVDYVLEYKVKPKNASESTAIEVHVQNSTVVINIVYMPETDSYIIIFKTDGYDEKRRDIIYKDDKVGDEKRLIEENERKKKEKSNGLMIVTPKKEISDDENDMSALILAIEKNNTEKALSILNDGNIDVNTKITDNSALYMAVERNRTIVVKKLIEKKANVNYCDRLGKTPLFVAIEKDCDFEIIKQLVDAKADCNIRTKGRQAILVRLIRGNSEKRCEIIEYLLQNGADPNIPENADYTPLVAAIEMNGNTQIDYPLIQLLIKKKANVNAKNSQGRTPLTIAKRYKNKPVIDMLMAAGAN